MFNFDPKTEVCSNGYLFIVPCYFWGNTALTLSPTPFTKKNIENCNEEHS